MPASFRTRYHSVSSGFRGPAGSRGEGNRVAAGADRRYRRRRRREFPRSGRLRGTRRVGSLTDSACGMKTEMKTDSMALV